MPATPLIGEEFCFSINFTNAGGATGYGPYLASSVDEGITDYAIDFIDVPPRLDFIGTFDASGVLIDPISGQPITGDENGSAYDLLYPVGSVDAGSPPLVMSACAKVAKGAEIGVPLNVSIYPGFQFGDTATGDNGPILSSPINDTVTPQLARVEKTNSAPEGERTPGPDFPFNYRWQVDVSEGVTITDVLVEDNLPPEVQWTGGIISVSSPLGAGCGVTTPPNTAPTPGGLVVVECTSVTGSAAATDLVVTVPVYIVDTLNEGQPDQQLIQNTVDFEYSYQGTDYSGSDTSEVLAVHAAAQKSVSGNPLPGETLTYNVNFQLTDYPGGPGSGADPFIITDILPDGLAFATTVELQVNGAVVNISPAISANTPAAGQTTIIWDIGAAFGGVLPNGSTGSLRYRADILEFYSDGTTPVQAADELTNSLQLSSMLTQGGTGNNGSTAPIEITPNTPDKVVQAPNPLPPELPPGSTVTFRLTMDIPAGKTSNVVFTDYLPRPVFDVADFNVATDWRVLPPFASLSPTVTKNTADNSVTLDFGDVSAAVFTTLTVDLDATITGKPFADDLFLTNLFASSYENAIGKVIEGFQVAPITVGAPSLVITKGVFSVDNPDAVITPPPPANPRTALVDGDATGADGFDNIQYVITVENIGSQSAYTVTVQDPVQAGLACSPVAPGDVVNGAGSQLAFAPGDLFGPRGLVLTDPLAGNDGNPVGGGAPFGTDTAIITVNCSLEASVNPGETITNKATVRWVSTPGGNELFPTQEDDASVTIGLPTMTKTVISATPGYSGNPLRLHIGEIATYELTITVPEGTSPAVRLEDVLDIGLAHYDVLSITTNSGSLATSLGTFNDVLGNAGYLPVGSGDTAPDRKLVFGPANNANGFGDITNSDSDNSVDEVITVTYQARVLNATTNINGTRVNNRARWYWQPNDADRQYVQVSATNIGVIEPVLILDKKFNPDTGDNLSPPMVTMTISQAASASADAFDLTFVDPLPIDLGIVGGVGGVTLSNCPVASTIDVTRVGLYDTLSITWEELSLGNGDCTISFQTEFIVPIIAGVILENCAELRWQSMSSLNQPADGTPNNSPGIAVERTGDTNAPGGAANTYKDGACDQYKVFDVGINKDVKSTSQPQTDNVPGTPAGTESLTIGEEVTFELVVTLPEAPTVALSVTDALPKTGMTLELLSATTVAVGADLDPEFPNPTPVYSDTLGDGVNDTVELDYGLVRHTPLDGTDDEDRIRIEIVAKVLDIAANANNDLDSNTAVVRFLPNLSASGSYGIEIVEPVLSIEKSANTDRVEAGDEVLYRITLKHATASRVAAENLVLTDALPPELSLVPGSVVVGPACSTTPTVGPTEGANSFNASWDEFPLGAVCEIDFRAVVDISAITGKEIINDATIDWTSLTTTGDPDDRQYQLDDTWKIVVSPPGLSKEMTSTSIPDTPFSLGGPSPDLTIGEEATFTVTAEFPDGTTRGVRISDLLPDVGVALAFTDTQIVSVGSDLTVGTSPSVGDPAANCMPPAPNCQQWILGNVINQPDSRPQPDAADTIVFEVTAIVMDNPINSGAPGEDKNLLNTAQLQSPDAQLVDTAQFNLVEPRLSLQKLTENGRPEDTTTAGQNYTFTLVVGHEAISTATARTIEIVDTLAPEMEWVSDGSVISSCPGLQLDQAPPVGNSGQLVFSFDKLTLTRPRCVISFVVKMSDTLPVPGVYTNEATMTWESAPGSPQSRSYSTQAFARLAAFVDAFMVKEVSQTSVSDTGVGVGDPQLEDVAIGEIIEYLVVSKFSEGTTSNVVVTDNFQLDGNGELELLGGAVVFVGANITTTQPGNPVIVGNSISIDYGDVTNTADGKTNDDDTITYRLELRVKDVAANTDGETLLNATSMEYQVTPGIPNTVSANAVVEIVEPVLVMTKQFTDLVGAEATIALELVNNGNAPAYDVVISDDFDEALWVPGSLVAIAVPAGYELTESSAGGFTTVTLTASSPATPPAQDEILHPGEPMSVSFSMLLQNNGQPGPTSIPNTAEVEATSLPGLDPAERTYNTDATDTLLLPAIDLLKAWTGPNNPALPGDTLTYTLTLANTGQAPVSDIVILDTPDSIGTLVNGSVTPVSTGNGGVNGIVIIGNTSGDNSVEVTLASLEAGASIDLSYKVEVPLPYPDGMSAPEQLVNQGSADTTELPRILSGNTTADDDPTIVPVLADPIMTLDKDDQVNFTQPGGILVYTLLYGNRGDQDATGVFLTETVPANTVFNSANSTAGWSCTNGAVAGTSCTLLIDKLPGAGLETAYFAVQVDNPVLAGVSTIFNTATVEEDGIEFGQPPSTPSTATDDEQTPLLARPQLEITKTDGGITVIPGQTYSYAIAYSNTGNQQATGLVLTETVPNDVIYNANGSLPYVWSCPNGSLEGTVCTLDGGSLQAGQSGLARFGVLVLNPAASGVGFIANTVEITDDGTNSPLPLTDQDADTTPLLATPDLTITKTTTAGTVRVDDIIVYELAYANVGNQDATGTIIREVVPPGTEFSAPDSLPTAWSCADRAGPGTVCEYVVGDFAAGASGTLTFALVAVDIPKSMQVVNIATINNDGNNGVDPTPLNNITTVINRFPIPSIPTMDPRALALLALAMLLLGAGTLARRRAGAKTLGS